MSTATKLKLINEKSESDKGGDVSPTFAAGTETPTPNNGDGKMLDDNNFAKDNFE